MKQTLIGMNAAEIQAWVTELGEQPFRAKQLTKWLYEKHVRNFEAMTDLSKAFRANLEAQAEISSSKVRHTVRSSDGTTKFLIELHDGQVIECVTIVQGNHLTACVSSQVGCNVGCPFCATGLSGFRRNLHASEIVDQYLIMQHQIDQGFLSEFTEHTRISRIVFMGMGEPLLNYREVVKAIGILNKEIGIGIRNITISTSGVIPQIRKLMEEPMDYNLAISLHSARADVRDTLVPLNRKHTLPELLAVAKEYAEKTGRRITFEYTLLQGHNTSLADADILVKALKGIHCHVNLIAYNPVDSQYQAPPRAEIRAFQERIRNSGIPVNLRHNHGQDDMAACGQLSLTNAETMLRTVEG